MKKTAWKLSKANQVEIKKRADYLKLPPDLLLELAVTAAFKALAEEETVFFPLKMKALLTDEE